MIFTFKVHQYLQNCNICTFFFSLAEPQFIHENKPGDYESKSSCVTSAEETEGSTMSD